MKYRLRDVVFSILLLATLAIPLTAQAQEPEWPQTWQERNGFKGEVTPFDSLMEFWYELARLSPEVSIRPLTLTLLDREFTLVTVSRDPITNPQDAIRYGTTI